MKTQTNVRLSKFSRKQLEIIVRATGMNQNEVIQMAIDRLYLSPDMYSQIDPWKEIAEPPPVQE